MLLSENEAVQRETSPQISPFSSSIPSELDWKIITSKEYPVKAGLMTGSDEEDQCLTELGLIGVIGGKQLERIYLDFKKKQLKKLVEQRKIQKHTFKRGNSTIPIYSLGVTGLKITENLGESFQANEWVTMTAHRVLRSLLFFQLLGKMKEWSPVRVKRAEDPFIGIIEMNQKEYHILILRGNERDIQHYFRYVAISENCRILLIAESVEHVGPIEKDLLLYMKQIRLTTDADLTKSASQMFRVYEEQEWVPENLKIRRG